MRTGLQLACVACLLLGCLPSSTTLANPTPGLSNQPSATGHAAQPLQQQAISDISGSSSSSSSGGGGGSSPPWRATPPVWPDKFKATLFQNRTSKLALTTLYYDWKLGANLNIIANQLGKAGTVWDLEWNNGTSFIFSRDQPVCKVLHFDVGILTPDWLANSTHLGQMEADTFVCDVWTKAEFINYFADVETSKPVRWTFLGSSAEFHVLEFNEGEALPDKLWQAPKYCFSNASSVPTELDAQPLANGRMFRLQAAQEVEAAVLAKQQQQQQQLFATVQAN